MSTNATQLVAAQRVRRSAFTLLELLIVIAIILILLGVAMIGTHAAHGYMRKSNAQQQLKLISNAIDQYSSFWTKWQVGSVVVAEKGWPDFIPGRLFAGNSTGGPFNDVAGFNDKITFESDGPNSGISYNPSGDMVFVEGDVEHGSECLAYSLTATAGKGPYIKDEMKGNLQTAHENEFYPSLSGAGLKRGEIVDPWGTPYRYFWVYADPGSPSFKGYLTVDYAAFFPGNGNGGVSNNAFRTPSGAPKTAVGYVLESAGPDKKFGNVWKANPTTKEIEDAADNLTISP